jgi:hypothetical protein
MKLPTSLPHQQSLQPINGRAHCVGAASEPFPKADIPVRFTGGIAPIVAV